jgi:hypothetical protein
MSPCRAPWCHPDIILMSPCAILMPSWCHTGAILMPSWCQPDTILVPFWCHPDVTLMPSWCLPDVILIPSLSLDSWPDPLLTNIAEFVDGDCWWKILQNRIAGKTTNFSLSL